MKIAIIGASGNAGARLVREAQRRGHAVTAVTRNPLSYAAQADEVALAGDVNDPELLAQSLSGHDVVISSVTFEATDPALLIEAVRSSGVKRYLSVGGAGSLEVAPGRLFIDEPDFPAEVLEESRRGKALLQALIEVDDLDWTMVAPSAYFVSGDRTGVFRLGENALLVDENGKSWITYEDLAVAMLDEIETPRSVRRRITVGY